MIFNSGVFLGFFLLFFLLYWQVNRRCSVAVRNILIILASYLFYGWWDTRFLLLIILSSVIDYIIGWFLGITKRQSWRYGLLLVSIIVNLGVLGFFKYFNFFVDSFTDLASQFSTSIDTPTLKVILPVGISFYTLQTLSYTIDIYRRKIRPTKDLFVFFAFVSFFPQLVAGPIERASRLLPQFGENKTFDYERFKIGLRLILWGFFKKIVIADNFGVLADNIFAVDTQASGPVVIIGACFFALQIYADFSGYSDIAIGIAKMLGFDLMTNFKTPYLARSFGDFWSRWHISLSSWIRDYVYIPLGGNKKGSFLTAFNIMVAFLVSGFWHGANYTFLIWGGLHGSALIIEKYNRVKLPRILSNIIVLGFVILLWIPFRAIDITHLNRMMLQIIDFKNYDLISINAAISLFSPLRFLFLMSVLIAFANIEYKLRNSDFNDWIGGKSRTVRIIIYYTLCILIIILGNFSTKPSFIYFQF